MNVGYARMWRSWSATTCRCASVCRKGENTNMILFAIICDSLEVVYTATVIGMLIVSWAIYTVYTGGFCDL